MTLSQEQSTETSGGELINSMRLSEMDIAAKLLTENFSESSAKFDKLC